MMREGIGDWPGAKWSDDLAAHRVDRRGVPMPIGVPSNQSDWILRSHGQAPIHTESVQLNLVVAQCLCRRPSIKADGATKHRLHRMAFSNTDHGELRGQPMITRSAGDSTLVVLPPARRGRTVTKDGPDPIDVFVGHRLRQARRLAGLSQDELGDAIGVSFQAVQKYEQGENRISASRLARAAKVLSLPIAFFFPESDQVSEPPSPNEMFSRDERELVRSYRELDGDEKRHHIFLAVKNLSVACTAKPGQATKLGSATKDNGVDVD